MGQNNQLAKDRRSLMPPKSDGNWEWQLANKKTEYFSGLRATNEEAALCRTNFTTCLKSI
jgi:hypothetical protein